MITWSFIYEIPFITMLVIGYFAAMGILLHIFLIARIPYWWNELLQSFRDARYKPVRDYDKIIKQIKNES